MRVGAGGIMLPNHSPLRVAEEFRTLEAMFPGRIDLGLGRAPGTDGTTAWALRRSREAVVNDEFVTLAAQLFAFLEAGAAYPDDHPFASVIAAPRVPSPAPDLDARIERLRRSVRCRQRTADGVRPSHQPGAGGRRHCAAYRREFQPSERADAPYSVIAVNAFASDDPTDVDDYVALQTLLWWRLRRNELRPMTIEEAREFARRPDYEQIRDGLGRELFVGTGAEVVRCRREAGRRGRSRRGDDPHQPSRPRQADGELRTARRGDHWSLTPSPLRSPHVPVDRRAGDGARRRAPVHRQGDPARHRRVRARRHPAVRRPPQAVPRLRHGRRGPRPVRQADRVREGGRRGRRGGRDAAREAGARRRRRIGRR